MPAMKRSWVSEDEDGTEDEDEDEDEGGRGTGEAVQEGAREPKRKKRKNASEGFSFFPPSRATITTKHAVTNIKCLLAADTAQHNYIESTSYTTCILSMSASILCLSLLEYDSQETFSHLVHFLQLLVRHHAIVTSASLFCQGREM